MQGYCYFYFSLQKGAPGYIRIVVVFIDALLKDISNCECIKKGVSTVFSENLDTVTKKKVKSISDNISNKSKYLLTFVRVAET